MCVSRPALKNVKAQSGRKRGFDAAKIGIGKTNDEKSDYEWTLCIAG